MTMKDGAMTFLTMRPIGAMLNIIAYSILMTLIMTLIMTLSITTLGKTVKYVLLSYAI
jgi:hypothetical protein